MWSYTAHPATNFFGAPNDKWRPCIGRGDPSRFAFVHRNLIMETVWNMYKTYKTHMDSYGIHYDPHSIIDRGYALIFWSLIFTSFFHETPNKLIHCSWVAQGSGSFRLFSASGHFDQTARASAALTSTLIILIHWHTLMRKFWDFEIKFTSN